MQPLNSIACEHCRSKKCKCDRKLPHCSQCNALSLPCRYTEGGKRGIPAAYINSLEHRLVETEAALYSALAAIDSVNAGPASLHRLVVDPSALQSPEPSKIKKQDEWRRLPLRSGEQLRLWFDTKSQSDHRHVHPSAECADERAGTEALAHVVEPSRAPSPVASPSHSPAGPSITSRLADSPQWRNYF